MTNTTRWNGRNSTNARKYLRQTTTWPTTCTLCGRTLHEDDQWIAGHIIGRDQNPDETMNPANWRIECKPCSDRSGGKYAAAKKLRTRTNGKTQPKSPVKGETDFFDTGVTTHRPLRRHYLSDNPEIPPDCTVPFTSHPRDRSVVDGFPLMFPAPHADAVGSWADDAVRWIEARWRADKRARASSLRWWQWLVLQRLLEFRADGSWCWPVSLVSVSRQSGKSELLCELAAWRCAHAGLFGGWPQEVGHSANTVVLSRRVQASRWFWAERNGLRVARQLGDSQVIWPDESVWRTMAPENMYGRSLDMILADEAWHWDATDFWQSTFPTLVERPSAQAVLFSAAHDQPRSLVASLLGDGSVAVMLWGAPVGADVLDPGVWRAASPFWSPRRELAMQLASAKVSFGSQWLNLWPSVDVSAPSGWGERLSGFLPAASDPGLVGPVVLALESDPDGGSWGVAVSDGRHVLAVSVPRLSDAVGWLESHGLTAVGVCCHEAVVLQLPPGFGLPVFKVSESQSRAALARFRDAVESRSLSWSGVLDQQLRGAVVRGGAGLESVDAFRSAGSVSALKAASWAVWRCVTQPATAPAVW